ncbi:hypothetical protein TrRE_jg8571 [Triparma retinervis]|uniref:Tyrosine-protein kinase ephrin type A/B receptor-like domain-containing protein n=1 Tax=Triparma retinervis TaxID=2557542 RepID=A0A9W7FHA2_9STRA|nr:hypothetical protein TrRE_jg8571 [Triparma retinervis]
MGKYSGAGSDSCTNCGTGKYNANTKSPSESSCTECVGGTANPNTGSTGEEACVDCGKGRYSDPGSSSCTDCAKGKYNSKARSPECTKCKGGKYNIHMRSEAVGDCKNCTAGKYSPTIAATMEEKCTDCDKGYSSGEGQAAQTICAKGKWNNQTAQSSCRTCIAGTYNDKFGMKFNQNCTKCPENTYSNVVGATSNATCTNCPSGKASGEGSTYCLSTGVPALIQAVTTTASVAAATAVTASVGGAVTGGGAGAGAGAGGGGGGVGGGDPISMIFVVQFASLGQQLALPDVAETLSFKGIGSGMAWLNFQVRPPFRIGTRIQDPIPGSGVTLSANEQFLLSMQMSAEELWLGNFIFILVASVVFVKLHLRFAGYVTRKLAIHFKNPKFRLPASLLFPAPEVLLFFIYYQGIVQTAMITINSGEVHGFVKFLASLQIIAVLGVLGFFAWFCWNPNKRIRTVSMAMDPRLRSMSKEQREEAMPSDIELVKYKDANSKESNLSIKDRYMEAVYQLKNRTGKWSLDLDRKNNDHTIANRVTTLFFASFSSVFSKMTAVGFTFFFLDCFRKILFIFILTVSAENGAAQAGMSAALAIGSMICLGFLLPYQKMSSNFSEFFIYFMQLLTLLMPFFAHLGVVDFANAIKVMTDATLATITFSLLRTLFRSCWGPVQSLYERVSCCHPENIFTTQAEQVIEAVMKAGDDALKEIPGKLQAKLKTPTTKFYTAAVGAKRTGMSNLECMEQGTEAFVEEVQKTLGENMDNRMSMDMSNRMSTPFDQRTFASDMRLWRKLVDQLTPAICSIISAEIVEAGSNAVENLKEEIPLLKVLPTASLEAVANKKLLKYLMPTIEERVAKVVGLLVGDGDFKQAEGKDGIAAAAGNVMNLKGDEAKNIAAVEAAAGEVMESKEIEVSEDANGELVTKTVINKEFAAAKLKYLKSKGARGVVKAKDMLEKGRDRVKSFGEKGRDRVKSFGRSYSGGSKGGGEDAEKDDSDDDTIRMSDNPMFDKKKKGGKGAYDMSDVNNV